MSSTSQTKTGLFICSNAGMPILPFYAYYLILSIFKNAAEGQHERDLLSFEVESLQTATSP